MLSTRRRRTLSRNEAKTFPLPEDFFPKIELTDEQIQGYETQVERIVQDALADYERHEAKGAYPIYSAPWVPVGTEGTLTAIRKETSEKSLQSEFRLYGCIQGNYRNFMDFHYAETSQELFECNQFMYGYVCDAVVLKNIHTKNSGKTHEYLGIKWTCLQPSSFGRRRDNCFLEYLTYTKDELGRKVGVRVTLPVEIDECPDLYRTLKIKRIKTHSVSIVRPAGFSSDATQLFFMSDNDIAGLSVSAKNYKKVMRIYNDMSLFVDSKGILRQGIMCKTNWVPKDSRKACTNCQVYFNAATRRRYHCRLCGDLFCHRCVIVRNVPRDHDVKNRSRVFQVAKTHFCTACVSTIRRGSEASKLERASSATHASSVKTLRSESNDRKLRKTSVSDTTKQSSSRSEWWDEIASYRSESKWFDSNWSETESEDASKASLNASGRSTLNASGRSRLASSLSSSQSSWTSLGDKNMDKDDVPFLATLDVIDDDVAILDEKARSSKSKLCKKLPMSGYLTSQRHSRKQMQNLQTSVDTQEVAEVIDTIDMMPMSELRRQSRARTAGVVLYGVARKNTKRRNGRRSSLSSSRLSSHQSPEEPTNRFHSSRSISQSLAEQEEILRCMLSVSRVHLNSGEGFKS